MSEQEASKAQQEKAQAILRELLRLTGFEGKVEAFSQEDGSPLLHIETADAARLSGRNAQVLDALQTVVNRILAREAGQPSHCVVDVERYRERRKDRLLKMAFDAAEQVERTGSSVKLPPMNAGERRIIHQALKDNPRLRTFSEESREEGEKRVVVVRAGAGTEVSGQKSEVGSQKSEVSGQSPAVSEDDPADNIGNR
jgi:spoIIIJ-associated protein